MKVNFAEFAKQLSAQGVLGLCEGVEIEFKEAAGRDGCGELPKSLWETYSAFANTAGGVIVLGVRESAGRKLSVLGVPDREKVMREFWSLGGVANSDCRNRTIQKMFEMIGYAEQAGSGFPKILAGCDFWGVKHPEMSEDIELYQMKFIFHRPGGVKGGVKGGVNREEDSIDALINIIRNNPGKRIPFYAEFTGRTIKAVEHDVEDLKQCVPPKIEFRGAPKTGGYYVKETKHD